jgi:CRISPR-associated protein Cas5d
MEKYVTNYRGPLRKSSQISKNASYQLPATILVDVCYRVHGECIRIGGTPDEGGNAPHALKEMFERRLDEGKSKYAPSLGWKEFLPTYFGPPRPQTDARPERRLQDGLEFSLPGFLLSVWDSPTNGKYSPIFAEVMVKNGTLLLPKAAVRNGKLHFETIADYAR